MAKRKPVRKATKAKKAAPKKAAPKKAARKAVKKAAKKVAAKKRPAARKAAPRKKAAPARKAVVRKPARKGQAAPKKVAARKPAPASAKATVGRPKPAPRPAVRPAVKPLLSKAAASAPVEGRKAPALNRARRVVLDDDVVMSPPSTLDMDRRPSAAKSGGRALHDRIERHHDTSPALTAGDVDADWESAESVGDEAPGGENMTPDQDVVDEIGAALGVEYDDDEELQGGAEISERDEHRWDDEDS